jgi:hypothetical protein
VAVSLICIPAGITAAGQYKNFKVSVYTRVYEVREMKDPAWLEPRWKDISAAVKVDKVYLETHRDMVVADRDTVLGAKKFFHDHGVETAGGITITVNEGNRFQTYCYSNPEHRKKLKEVVEYTAGMFDEIILDDFFFTNCKCELCIKAKGKKSWTRFRLDQLDEAARNLIVGPAKAVNPKVKMVVKYPNWYEHFQGLGFNVETEPGIFDGLYTGTETRDRTGDQHLQEYLGYQIFRYFENLKPGGNGGGWVDTYGSPTVDRFAEQLWLTAFAKAPEVTLFNFTDILRPIRASERSPWQDQKTSFDFDSIFDVPLTVVTPSPFGPPAAAKKEGVPEKTSSYARAAGKSLEQVDAFLGKLGKPVGLKSYRPHHAVGEDFLHNYLGMVGVPIDLRPTFPTEDKMILLTESAAADPALVDKIKAQLVAGKSVTITSGLLRALQGKGIEDIVEIRYTDRKARVKGFRGTPDLPAESNILIPQLHYLTNDAWEIIGARTENDLGYPLLIQAGYAKGQLYVLVIPENFSDLYSFPTSVLNQIRNTLLGEMPVRVEAPGDVSIFMYDNDTFIVESFLPEAVDVNVSLDPRFTRIQELTTGETIDAPAPKAAGGFFGFYGAGGNRHVAPVKLKPHSYRVFAALP